MEVKMELNGSLRKKISYVREKSFIKLRFSLWWGLNKTALERTYDFSFWNNKHYFVVGCSHSGTSILTAILARHPLINPVVGESNFFRSFGKGAEEKLIEWNAMLAGGERIIEKTPRHLSHVNSIKSLFPNSIVVSISRNPLDTIASLKKRYNNFNAALQEYLLASDMLIKNANGGLIDLHVRYEDLLDDPDYTLKKILEYGGLSDGYQTSPSAEHDWYNGKTEHEKLRNWQINQPLYDTRGSYKKILSDVEIKIISERTQKHQKYFLYENYFPRSG